MTLTGLVDAINRAGIKLSVNGGKLRVDAPTGAMNDELRASLTEHKLALLGALASATPAATPTRSIEPTEPEDVFIIATDGQEILIDADMMASAVNVLRDWLWMMASTHECGTVYDRRRKPWHVRETVGRLLMSIGGRAWLEETCRFYDALRRERPQIPHVGHILARL